ncbi:M28 family peptidase [Kangiella sediminilitoris]|uniref:Peptidase M28 n=1 Tax=Kangiella sediminilitoris TaxID=1144748 RepID=A0A1B3BDI0_9GAMM|nr:M28 family peptidase [Kangiella sediminilitoris]AOE50747.1 Peptidase M28 [Kangiella sediminilitoris]
MKSIILNLLVLIGLGTPSVTLASEKSENKDNQLAQQWINYLAHDDRQGRLTGSEENLEVQDWLVERFKELGIKTLPGKDTYRQPFTATDRQGEPRQAANIIGYIPCQCENDRYFMIGAHYDHVGTNPKLDGDTIFNGADDDASGVVATLVLAKSLQQYDSLPFNIIVAAWDAEEMGLQGSDYFANNPWVELSKIESGFMFELVGVPLEDKLNSAWMTGDQYSSLYPVLKDALGKQGWELDPVLDPKMGLFFRSDNAPFALLDAGSDAIKKAFEGKGKVSVTGIPMHAISVWRGQGHYHQTHDEAELINIPNLVSLAQALAAALSELPQDTKINWHDNPQFEFSRP